MGALDQAHGLRLDRLAALVQERDGARPDAGPVHGQDLGQDERLGQPREARHHVGHDRQAVPAHRP